MTPMLEEVAYSMLKSGPHASIRGTGLASLLPRRASSSSVEARRGMQRRLPLRLAGSRGFPFHHAVRQWAAQWPRLLKRETQRRDAAGVHDS